MKANEFSTKYAIVRVYKDDDFDEKGWAYEVRRKSDNEVTQAGHTYDHDRDDSIEYASGMAYMVDRDGKPYIEDESDPAGGGLDGRCDFNKEATRAFDSKDHHRYLKRHGFELVENEYPNMEAWEKGNTRVVLESFIDGLWGYVHTEFIG